MANEQNLKPGVLTAEKAAEMGRKGGIASGESRRRRRTLREATQQMLSAQMTPPTEEVAELLKQFGIEKPTAADVMTAVAMLKSIAKADVEAMRFVRDTGGEAPTAKLEVGGMDDKPIAMLDLSSMTDEQLVELAMRRSESQDSEG